MRGAWISRALAWLCLLAFVAILATGALGSDHARRVVATDGPSCPFRTATGVDCPFCGMTRATLALGAGDWHGALRLHPLAPLVLAFTLALLVIVATGRGALLVEHRRPLWILLAIAAIWLVRLIVG